MGHYELLTQLLKKDVFQWNEEATNAFGKLKQAMISLPMLILHDFSLQFVLEMDTSSISLGVMLMQHDQLLILVKFYLRNHN